MSRLALLLGAFVLAASVEAAAQAKPSPQTNREGPVTVKVAPLALSAAAESWRFEVTMDTHSVPLAEDMRAAAVLAAGASERTPLSWEGDPPGGHHRKGVLTFEPLRPPPASVTLKIRGVGGVAERSFAWPVANP